MNPIKHSYNGTEFELRPFDIKTKQAFVKVSFEIDKINKILLQDVDVSLKDKYNDLLKFRLTAQKQLQEIESRNEEQEKQLRDLTEKINKVYEDMKLDTEYQTCIESINLALAQSTGFVCQDINIMKPFLESVLIGDLTKLDWGWDIDVFCQKVLLDFFFYTVKSKRE